MNIIDLDTKEGLTLTEYELKASIVQLFENTDKFNPFYMSGVIDDGTMNIRFIVISNLRHNIETITGLKAEVLAKMKEEEYYEKVDFLGKEFLWKGRLVKNKAYGRVDFVVNEVKSL